LRIDNHETLDLEWLPIDNPPSTAPWYRAMTIDFCLRKELPSFMQGRAGKRKNKEPFFKNIEEQIDQVSLLLPVATAFIQDERERILLLRCGNTDEWDPPSKISPMLPGGSMRLGERIDQTIIVEVYEKTGLTIEPIRLLGVYSDNKYWFTSVHGAKLKEISFIFQGQIRGEQLETNIRLHESRFFPLNALPRLSTQNTDELHNALADPQKVYF